jgi:hypothetical protein
VLLIMQIRYFERYFAKKDILPLDDSWRKNSNIWQV